MQKQTKSSGDRIDSLDYLRGLSALGIMFYHMILFTSGEVDASSVYARIKIYAVPVFYILSGLTLYLVYNNKLSFSKKSLGHFYIKRFFRIAPLLWLVTLLTVLVQFNTTPFSVKKIIANLTIVPGAIKPETFIANGAWSIGNELFFYFLFPFLLFIFKRNKKIFCLSIFMATLLFVFFSFKVLNPEKILGSQWAVYVHPLNQVFFFVAGVGLGLIGERKEKLGNWPLILSILLLVFITFFPVSGDPIQLVTGYTRLALSVATIGVCFFFYQSNFDFLPRFAQKALSLLGEISYSLYLIHPLVFFVLQAVLEHSFPVRQEIQIGLTIILSLVLSYFNYVYFEKYFIHKGNKIIEYLTLKAATVKA